MFVRSPQPSERHKHRRAAEALGPRRAVPKRSRAAARYTSYPVICVLLQFAWCFLFGLNGKPQSRRLDSLVSLRPVRKKFHELLRPTPPCTIQFSFTDCREHGGGPKVISHSPQVISRIVTEWN